MAIRFPRRSCPVPLPTVLNPVDAPVPHEVVPHSGARFAAELIIDSLPDLVLWVGRDGTLLAHGGGGTTSALNPRPGSIGKSVDAIWPARLSSLLKQLARTVSAQHEAAAARFTSCGVEYVVHASPQGTDRVVCVIRPLRDVAVSEPPPEFERGTFLQRLRESLAWATVRETPLALAIIHIDGFADISAVLAAEVSEQVIGAARRRLPPQREDPASARGGPCAYLGLLSASLLAVVIDSDERAAIEACVNDICASLRAPIHCAEADFHLTPYVGVAIAGRDTDSPQLLLERARAASLQARRSGRTRDIHFFTDSVQLRALARIDLRAELRRAIDNGEIRLRYRGRHDLRTDRLVGWVGSLHWIHPQRGQIRPAEFIRVAAATGLASALSRSVLEQLREDFARLTGRGALEGCISFAALQHHVLDDLFLCDVAQLVAAGGIPAARLELRIAEKVFVTRPPEHAEALKRLGVRLVVDEVGRDLGSLPALARAPLSGLQLDRAWVTVLHTDPIAATICRAGIALANALGVEPIASGVDTVESRATLLALGCTFGSGDFYREEDWPPLAPPL